MQQNRFFGLRPLNDIQERIEPSIVIPSEANILQQNRFFSLRPLNDIQERIKPSIVIPSEARNLFCYLILFVLL